MKTLYYLIPAVLLLGTNSFAGVKVQNLLCETLENPIGLDVLQPRFSWQLISRERNPDGLCPCPEFRYASRKIKIPVR